MYVVVCVYVCVYVMCVVLHQPGNRKVSGLMPNYANLVLLFTHIAPIYPAVYWGPGGLGKQPTQL